MTVDKLIEELTKAQKAGFGDKQIRLEVPCLCENDDGDIVENDHRTRSISLSIKAKDIIKSGKATVIPVKWTDCSYDEYMEDEMSLWDPEG